MALQDTLDQLQNFDFNDLDINNVGSWPGPVKIILMAIVFVIVLGSGYYFHLTDKQALLERSETQEISLRKDYESKSMQAANLDAYRRQREEMRATFGALLRQLPSDTEVPGLAEDINRMAVDNELTIESMVLQNERQTEFYVELPIDIVVEGDYHKIGAFVSGVANLSRIVTLHDFRMVPQESAQQLKMTILAKTYRYLEEEE